MPDLLPALQSQVLMPIFGRQYSVSELFYSNKFSVQVFNVTNHLSTEYCELKYPDRASADRLTRDLTSKCGEERRKLTKKA